MTFPIIMCAAGSGGEVIVFFTAESSGVILQCLDREYAVGEYLTDWDMECFVKYTGELKMSNAILLAAFLQ